MPFPSPTDKVVYERNPLAEVTARIFYWPLLVVERDRGAAFQELVRRDYPFLTSDSEKTREFVSDDELWKVLLEPELLSLSTRVYTRWVDFRARLNFLINSFQEAYGEPQVGGVHLMYRDLIIPDELGLEPGQWSWPELLDKSFYQEIGSPQLASQVVKTTQVIELQLQSCPGLLQLSLQLETTPDGKEFAVIDSLFHHALIGDFSDALVQLDAFRELASVVFRWTITDKLHDLLAPQIVNE